MAAKKPEAGAYSDALDVIMSDEKVAKRLNDIKGLSIGTEIVSEMKGMYVLSRDASVQGSRVMVSTSRKEIEKVMSMLNQTQAYKDRLSDIKITLVQHRAKLEKEWDTLTNYIYAHYADKIAVAATTADMRKRIEQTVLPALHKKREEAREVEQIADLVASNLKDNYFTLVAIKDLMLAVLENKI